MAVLALTLAGQAAGSFVGGSLFGAAALGGSIGGALGGALGSHLFGPKPPDQQGPRVTDLETTTASEGTPIPYMWGSMRIVGDPTWAPPLTERTRKTSAGGGGKGGGGGGGTVETFFATGTWAVSFGYNREGVPRILRRVWANKELVYDQSGEGQIYKEGFEFVYYDGTQTEPDPTEEGIIGEGNVPAYTGQARMLFTDQNLETWGNRIPQIEAELVDDGAVSPSLTRLDLTDYGYSGVSLNVAWITQHEATGLLWTSFHSGLFGRYGAVFVVNPWTKQIVWSRIFSDIPGRNSGDALIISYQAFQDRVAILAEATDGEDRFQIYDPTTFQLLGTSGTLKLGTLLGSAGWRPLFQGIAFADSSNYYYWPGDNSNALTTSGPAGYTPETWRTARKTIAVDALGARLPFEDVAHALIGKTATPTVYGFFSLSTAIGAGVSLTQVVSSYASGPDDETSTGFQLPEGLFKGQGIYAEDTDSYWFPFTSDASSDEYLVEIDPTDGEILALYNLTSRIGFGGWGTLSGYPIINYDSTTRSIWFKGMTTTYSFNVVSKALESYSGSDDSSGPAFFHAPGGLVIGAQERGVSPLYDRIYFHTIGNVSQGGIAVSSVIKDALTRDEISVPSSSIVFNNVNASVTGAISNTRLPVKELVSKLLQFAYADGYESEYALKFAGRGAAVATTLSEDYLGAIDPSSQPDPTEETMSHEIELPRSMDVRYFNSENSFQTGDAHFAWHSSPSNRKSTVNLPVAITPQQAIERAELFLHSLHQRNTFRITTGPFYGDIEPTDIIEIPVNDRLERVRVDRVRRGVNGIRDIIATQESTQDAVAVSSAAGDTPRDTPIQAGGPVQPFWLDTNLLQDTDGDFAGPYTALYDYASGFPVGYLFTSPDDNSYVETSQFDAEPSFGIVAAAPNDISDFGVWDRDNTLTVTMLEGASDMQSTTSAAVFAGANAAAWGRTGRWEIVQYLSVAVTSTGQRQVSSLLRGRRGTDSFINDHTASDFFVVLDDASLSRLQYPVAQIGAAVYARAVRAGQSYADVSPSIFSVPKAALRPYSPISAVVASASTGGDLAGTFTRRTRIGGSYAGLYDQVGGTLSEDSESYEIDVVNPATGSTIVSTLVATTSTNFAYSSADQESDGVTSIGTITFRIFQISAAVGRGYPASVTYERPWETGFSYAVAIGAEHYLPLTDAGTSTLATFYGSAVGTWGASTGVASGEWGGAVRRTVASIAADSSTSLGQMGDVVANFGNGKKTISAAIWYEVNASIGTRYPMTAPGEASNDIALGFRDNGGCLIRPKGSGGAVLETGGFPDNKETDNPIFVVQTINTSTLTHKVFINGEYRNQTVYGSAASWFANPIEWSGGGVAFPGRIGGTPSGAFSYYAGKVADFQLYPTVLSSALVSTLYIKQQGYQDRLSDLGATHHWTLDYRTNPTVPPDIAGNVDVDFRLWMVADNPVHKTVQYGTDMGTTDYARAQISSDMRSQVFSIEAWVNFQSIGSNQPWLTVWPAGAFASAKGVQFLVDSTNGIRARYGDGGDGTFRYINASATTSTPYHVVFAFSSGVAPKLFVNGSSTSGASVVTIDWDDATGSPAPPTGTVYFNRSNQSATASVAPDQNGADIKMNSVAMYPTALSSAVVSATHKFGLKQL